MRRDPKMFTIFVLHELVSYMKTLHKEIYHLDCDNVMFHGLKSYYCHFSSGSQKTRVIQVI